MIGASEVGTVQPLVKEGQTVNKVRGASTTPFVNTAAVVLPMCVRSQLNSASFVTMILPGLVVTPAWQKPCSYGDEVVVTTRIGSKFTPR
jgi:hypothetical protein